MSAISQLSATVGAVFSELGFDSGYGTVVVSARPDLGDFQCNGALAAAKRAGTDPQNLAEDVAARLMDDARFADVSTAGPGFVNITLTDQAIADFTGGMSDDDRLGVPTVSQPLSVIVDYAGPNVAKSMHVGHLRATIIGDSLKRLFSHAGHHVLGDAHFGDWGLPMGMLIVATDQHHPDLPYFDRSNMGPFPDVAPVSLADLQDWYPEISARVGPDESLAEVAREATTDLQSGRPGYVALWEHFVNVSRESQERDFADLGVEFDLWYGESTVRDRLVPMVARAVESGVATESDGALVIDVSDPSDKKELTPFIIRTSHGTHIYSTFDLATVEHRVEELGTDLILYVVDARQSYHFEQVFRAARRTGAARNVVMEHIKFGTMNGPDGKPFKTRAGGVLRLRDLIELVTEAARSRLDESNLAKDYPEQERSQIARQVGISALKFGDLTNNRASNYTFDLERFTSFEGKTGPYLQMAAVRMKSILRKAADQGLAPGTIVAPSVPAERRLSLRLLQLPEVIGRAIELRAPNQLAEFAFDLASDFSSFYEACHILSEEDPKRQASWLMLVQTTLRTLELLLDLLGIETPERM